MKAFSQFVGEAYAVLGGTRFERRTPTSSELKAAQDARAATQGTFRQKEMAAIKASVKPPALTSAPTPSATPEPPATPAPRRSDIRDRPVGARANFDPSRETTQISRRTPNIPSSQPTAQSTGPGSAEDEEDIRKYYSNLPGFKYRNKMPIKASKVAPGYYTKGGKIYFDKSADQ